MDQETKAVIKPLIECLSFLAEKQSVTLDLIALHSSGLSEDEKKKIQASARESEKRAQEIRQSLKALK